MKKASYEDLIDIWWKTAAAMQFSPGESSESMRLWHAAVFEKCLKHLGWEIAEWNESNEALRKKLSEKKVKGG